MARGFLLLGLLVALAALLADDASIRRQARAGVVFWHGGPGERRIALTFDDGPNEPYTSEIASYLRSQGVRATFFVVGRNAERDAAAVRAVIEAGHEVGNHSYSHADLLLESEAAVARQLGRTAQAIQRADGRAPTLFRPPYGFEDVMTLHAARRLGYTVVKWSISSKDWTRPGAGRIAARVLAQARNGAIVLLHDGNECHGGDRGQTVEAVRLLVPELKARGYALVTVSDLLHLR